MGILPVGSRPPTLKRCITLLLHFTTLASSHCCAGDLFFSFPLPTTLSSSWGRLLSWIPQFQKEIWNSVPLGFFHESCIINGTTNWRKWDECRSHGSRLEFRQTLSSRPPRLKTTKSPSPAMVVSRELTKHRQGSWPPLSSTKLPLQALQPTPPSFELCLKSRSRPGLSQTFVRHGQSATSRENFPGDGNDLHPPLSAAPFSSEGLDGKRGLLVTPTLAVR